MAKQDKPIGNLKLGIGLDGAVELGNTLDQLTKQMKQAESSMKANVKAFDNSKGSVEALEQKYKDLSQVTEIQGKKVEVLTKRREDAIKKYGSESKQVATLTTQLNNATAKYNGLSNQLTNTTKDLINASNGVDKYTKELRDNEKAMNEEIKTLKAVGDEAGAFEAKQKGLARQAEIMENAIDAQRKALEQMNQEFGESSSEAQQAENALEGLTRQSKLLNKQIESLESPSDALGDIGSTADDSSFKVGALAGAVGGLASSVVMKGIDALIDGFGFVTDAIGEASKVYNDFKTQLGVGDSEADALTGLANEIYASGIGDELEEVSQALIKVKQYGVEGDEEIKNMTTSALAYSKAFDADFNESLRGAQSLMKVYGLTSEQAFDLMTKGTQNGLNKTDELGDNLAEYATLFEESGYSASEMFSILEQGLDGGAYNLDKVNDLVKEFGIRFTDGSVEKGVENLGGNFTKLYNEAKTNGLSAKETFQLFANEIGTMTDETEKANALTEIFGTMGEDAGYKVISAMGGLKDTYKDVEGVQKELNENVKDTSAVDAFGRAFKSAGHEIGEAFLPYTGKIAEFIRDLSDKLLPKIKPAIDTMMKAIKPVLEKIGDYMEPFMEYSGLIIKYAFEIGKVFAQTLYPMVKPILEKIGDAFKRIFTDLTDFWNKHGQQIIQGLTNFIKFISPAIKLVVDLVSDYVDSIIGFIEGMVNVVMGVIKVFTGLFTGDFKLMWEGVKQIFTNTIKVIWNYINMMFFKKIASGVKNFAKGFGTSIKGLWSSVRNFFTNGTKATWNTIKGWVTNLGSKIKGLKNTLTNHIKGMWTNVKNAFSGGIKNTWDRVKNWVTNLGGKIKGLGRTFKNGIKGMWTNVKDQFKNGIANVVENMTNLPSKIGKAISKGKSFVTDAFKGIFNGAIDAIKKPINGIIGGANWVLGKLGADKISEWVPKYANGTDGHAGGLMMVNDGAGAEMVISPNGQAIIPQGRNVMMYGEKGTQVLTAENTAKVLGQPKPKYRYAKGTGILNSITSKIGDVFDYISNPKELVKKALGNFVNLESIVGYPLTIMKGLVSKATSALTSKVKSLFDDFGGGDGGDVPSVGGSIKGWTSQIQKASKLMGAHANAREIQGILAQIQRESGGNQRIVQSSAVVDVNTLSGNPARGLLQYIPQTFNAYKVRGFDNIYNGFHQLMAFFNNKNWRFDLPYGKRGWGPTGGRVKGYANGGYITQEHLATVGEGNNPEIIIPLSRNKRSRALYLLAQAQKHLGAESSGGGQASVVGNTGAIEAKLDILISLMTQLVQKDTTINLNGKKVGELVADDVRKAQVRQTKLTNRSLGIV